MKENLERKNTHERSNMAASVLLNRGTILNKCPSHFLGPPTRTCHRPYLGLYMSSFIKKMEIFGQNSWKYKVFLANEVISTIFHLIFADFLRDPLGYIYR